MCGKEHVTVLHDPSRPANNASQTSSACTQVSKEGPRRSCARIILLKVSDQLEFFSFSVFIVLHHLHHVTTDIQYIRTIIIPNKRTLHNDKKRKRPAKETLTYPVLDDQSTDVFVTDALLNDLNVSGTEVNLQVSTIVGTNTVRMRRVSGLQIQDINGEHAPVLCTSRLCSAKHPSNTQRHRHSRHSETMGSLEECVSVNRVTVQREELQDSWIPHVPQASIPLHQQDSVTVLVNKSRSKDVSTPQIIREMMELDYGELNYSRKICASEQVESIEDKRFCQITTTGIHQNQLGNWEAPLPFKTDEVNLPDNRAQCLRRLLSLKRNLSKDQRARENYIVFIQKILECQHASRVPADELTPTPGKVWYLPHFNVYHRKKYKYG